MSFKLESKIPKITAELERRAALLVKKTAFQIESHIKTSMAEEKHGREYKRGRRVHVASAPGESPAVDSDTLRDSIQTQVEGLSAVVGTNVEYAAVLEFGGARMAPRPAWGPAFEEIKPIFEAGLKELVK